VKNEAPVRGAINVCFIAMTRGTANALENRRMGITKRVINPALAPAEGTTEVYPGAVP
jgi:hypothetical protein